MPKPSRRKKIPVKISSHLSEWIKAFVIALVLLVLIRFFIIDLTSFSDSSMEKSILPGDVLVVKKYTYGARMPQRIFPQSWVNAWMKDDTLTPVTHLPYWRIPGTGYPDYNHLVLLNIPAPHQLPVDLRTRSVKRIIGLPGDIIEMKNAQVYINGKKSDNPNGIQWNYVIETKSGSQIEKFLEKYQITEGTRVRGRNRFLFHLTPQMADSISQLDEVRHIRRHPPEWDSEIGNPFGKNARRWNPDNFGPLTLPYKGYTIALSPENTDFYFYHLQYHEGVKVVHQNDSVFIDGEYSKEYTFRNNYYFFLGDNRHNTTDSRLWGMLPENHMIGQVSSVFFSFDKEARLLHKIRWRRLFSTIPRT